MDRLQIERTGGFGGFGGAGHVKSRGEVALSDLSPADKQAVEGLFRNPEKAKADHPPKPDAFVYHITRQTAAGTEVVRDLPEDAVPTKLKESVRDTLE